MFRRRKIPASPSRAFELGAAERAGRLREAAAAWLAAARGGRAAAAERLARLYEEGRGVVRSAREAARWYAIAAEAGHTEAAFRSALSNLAASAGSGPGAATARSLGRRAAEAGHPQARALLGSLLAAGIGGPPEPDAAEHWYREAAGAGDPAAARGLGCLLLARSSVDASWRQEALDWLERAARAGIAAAHYHLGVAWELESTGEEAAVRAAEYFDRALAHGYRPAALRLARLLLQGPETLRDRERGLTLLRGMARAGDVDAMLHLADILAREPGDSEEAATWLRAAAERGLVVAQRRLGEMYREGRCVPVDPRLAACWLERAASAGDGRAALELARLLRRGEVVADDPKAWLGRLEQAAARGVDEAAIELGLAYATGRDVAADASEAARWWRLAAQRGHGLAAVNLARLLMAGAGVPRDLDEAERLLLDAAGCGERHAPCALAELYALHRRQPERAAAWLARAEELGDLLVARVACAFERAGGADAVATVQRGAAPTEHATGSRCG